MLVGYTTGLCISYFEWSADKIGDEVKMMAYQIIEADRQSRESKH